MAEAFKILNGDPKVKAILVRGLPESIILVSENHAFVDQHLRYDSSLMCSLSWWLTDVFACVGGIMKCDVIAQGRLACTQCLLCSVLIGDVAGIVAAGKTVKLSVPLIVRLEGTNVDLGKRILQDSGMNIITADNLDDAAKKAVQAIN